MGRQRTDLERFCRTYSSFEYTLSLKASSRSTFCCDPGLVVPNQDQQAPLCPGMLDCNSHELLDQPWQDDLTRKCLRSFHYSLDVEMSGKRANRRQRSRFSLPTQAVQFAELLYFSVSSPMRVEGSGVLQIRICDLRQSANSIEARCHFVGQRFTVNEAVHVCGVDSLLVKLFGVERAAFDAGNFRSNQCGAAFEILRAKFCPYCQTFVVSCESIEMFLALARRRGIAARRANKCTVKFVFCHLKTR